MKYSIALLSAAVAVSAVQPHGHAHHRAHPKRDLERYGGDDKDYVVVPGPTVIAYVLNGQPISEADVQEGIKNGTLVWAPNGGLSAAPSSSSTEVATSTAAPSTYGTSSSSSYSSSTSSSYSTSSTSSSSTSAAPYTTYTSSTSAASSSYSTSSSSASSAAATYSGSSSSSSHSSSSSGTGVDKSFPDGEIDCSTFPSDYGAVPVDWLGLGGWTGVQNCEGESSAGFSSIVTVTTGCTEDSYCSYACPAGYQKSQWPTLQGATGQSIGGIQCKNGKLYKTNDNFDTLCIPGAEQVTILVKNSMSENVAVCRTDYPGTESETVPLNVEGGATENLTCPDASNYYTWEGSHTSAQYYVNPKGVSVSDACQWGSSANPWGNFAPLNLGVGYSAGAAWLAIFQNSPTTNAKLDFAVKVTGDGVSGSCKYSNGQYCSESGCSSTTGCTVSITSGTATFEFTDS